MFRAWFIAWSIGQLWNQKKTLKYQCDGLSRRSRGFCLKETAPQTPFIGLWLRAVPVKPLPTNCGKARKSSSLCLELGRSSHLSSQSRTQFWQDCRICEKIDVCSTRVWKSDIGWDPYSKARASRLALTPLAQIIRVKTNQADDGIHFGPKKCYCRWLFPMGRLHREPRGKLCHRLGLVRQLHRHHPCQRCALCGHLFKKRVEKSGSCLECLFAITIFIISTAVPLFYIILQYCLKSSSFAPIRAWWPHFLRWVIKNALTITERVWKWRCWPLLQKECHCQKTHKENVPLLSH